MEDQNNIDLDRLHERHLAEQRWDLVLEVVQKKVQKTRSHRKRIELLEEAAAIAQEKLGRPAAAIPFWEAILESDALHQDALLSLEALYALTGDLRQRHLLLTRLTEHPDFAHDQRQEAWLVEIAEYLERQQDRRASVRAWEEVATRFAQNQDAPKALERLYRTLSEWPSFVTLMSQRLEREPEHAALIMEEIIQALEQADEPAEAARWYDRLIELQGPDLEREARLEATLRNASDEASLHRLAELYLDRSERHRSSPQRFLQARIRCADVFEYSLGKLDEAFLVLLTAFQASTAHPEVLQRLENLARQSQRLDELANHLEDILGEADATTRAQLRILLAGWYQDTLASPQDAARHLKVLFDEDPSDDRVFHALEAALQTIGDYAGQVRLLEQRLPAVLDPQEEESLKRRLVEALRKAANFSTDPAQSARFHAKLGTIARFELSDPISAAHHWEEALAKDEQNIEAAGALADHYIAERRWLLAAPLLEMLLDDPSMLLDDREAHRRWTQFAVVGEELEQPELATRAWRQVIALSPRDLTALYRFGRICFQQGLFDDAARAFEKIVQGNQLRFLDPLERAEIHGALSTIYFERGDHQRGYSMLEKAGESGAPGLEGLRRAVEIATILADTDLLLRWSRPYLDQEKDPPHRFKHLMQIGDLHRSHQRLEPACQAYILALEIDPHSMIVLRKLLETLKQARRFREAVDVLGRLAEAEHDMEKRANLYYAMGVLSRDELKNPERAVTHLEQALDIDFRMFKAFEAIDRIFTDLKNWKELERAYRRMLRRIGMHTTSVATSRMSALGSRESGTHQAVSRNDRQVSDEELDAITFQLWVNLGEIYRSRLGLAPNAIAAYEAAAEMRPEDEALQEKIAELYIKGTNDPRGAIRHHQKILARDPRRMDSLHAIHEAWLASQEFDKAFCAAAVLNYYQQANYQERDYLQRYLGKNLKLASLRLNQELMDHLYHPDLDVAMSLIFSYLTFAFRPHYTDQLKAWGIHPKKDLMDPAQKSVLLRIVEYLGKTLALNELPAVYARPEEPMPHLVVVNADPPALRASGGILRGLEDRELAAIAARKMAFLRPELFFAVTEIPDEMLQAYLCVAADFARPSLKYSKPLGKSAKPLFQALQDLNPQVQAQLSRIINAWLDRPLNMDTAAWRRAADHTVSRFMLLMCNDLKVAADTLKREDHPPRTDLSPKDRIAELLNFALSEPYFILRRELQLSIDGRVY